MTFVCQRAGKGQRLGLRTKCPWWLVGPGPHEPLRLRRPAALLKVDLLGVAALRAFDDWFLIGSRAGLCAPRVGEVWPESLRELSSLIRVRHVLKQERNTVHADLHRIPNR